jgi:isopropylmalate/homocitrate/citramalate synthase
MVEKIKTKREIRLAEDMARNLAKAIADDLQKEMQIKKFIRDLRGTVLHIERNNLFIERKRRQLGEEGVWEILQEGNHVYENKFKEPVIIEHEIEGLEHYKLQHIDEFYELIRRLEMHIPRERILMICETVGAGKLNELADILSNLKLGVKLDAEKDNQQETE